MHAVKRQRYSRYAAGTHRLVDADVISETSVALTVNGAHWLSFLCTPIDLEALAVGFLFNEGLIASRGEIASVRVNGDRDAVDVLLTHPVKQPSQWRRTSGCTGGVTAVPAALDGVGAIASGDRGLVLHPAQVLNLAEKLAEAQDLYRTAGGVHTSALSDGERIVLCVEDVGRHNTFDKIVGRCLLEDVALDRRVLITTGRISSEMLQKAARIGAVFVISRTSPTSLAVELAQRWGVTLIGYATGDRFNVYAHGERIADEDEAPRSMAQ